MATFKDAFKKEWQGKGKIGNEWRGNGVIGSTWRDLGKDVGTKTHSNLLPDDVKSVLGGYTNVTSLGPIGKKAALNLSALSGIPQLTQLAAGLYGNDINTYTTNPFVNLNKIAGQPLQDFRSRNGFGTGADAINRRLDGASAVLRGSKKAIAYAAASALPGGAYLVFNLDGAGKTGFGWGSQDSPNAMRNDFTAQSNIATKWDKLTKEWKPKNNPLNLATPFRGDRVNAVDFQQSNLNRLYKWKPERSLTSIGLLDKLHDTQDFIKFYFTGPRLYNGSQSEIGNMFTDDDIMVFRATITTLEESYQAGWTPVQMIGRADPNYHYTSYGRDLSLSFVVAATDRDEMKPIYRKLNALAGYMAPTYDNTTIGLKGPWMRMTIGDLLVQQPVILESLSYTLNDADTTWEINIEDDPEMMQAPHKISISMNFKVITDYLPEKGGQFYTLAKKNDKWGSKQGTDNWLSDTTTAEQSASDRTDPLALLNGKLGWFAKKQAARALKKKK
jgi:hypothetical protein